MLSDAPATAVDPATVVRRYIEDVLSGGRPSAAAKLVAADALLKRTAALRSAFSDLDARALRMVSDDALVAVHLEAHGTHTGMFQGMPPTGRSWSASATAIYEVRGGRIVDFWVTWDLLGILDQVGGLRRAAIASA